MTTWTLQTAVPAAGSSTTGQAAFTDSGLRIDDTVTNTGTDKAVLDYYDQQSTAALKIGQFLAHLQRTDKFGRAWRAFDGSSTYINPTL